MPFVREEGESVQLKPETTDATVRLKPDTTYKHIGIYGYRRDFLLEFAALPQTPLERAESLEQLRWLEAGYEIYCTVVQDRSIGVDTPEQLQEAERELLKRQS